MWLNSQKLLLCCRILMISTLYRVTTVPQTLLIIDVQNDYFLGGKLPLQAADQALQQINRLVEYFNAQHWLVIYIQHINPIGASFFAANSLGVELHPQLQYAANSLTIQKQHPNSFDRTDLQQQLDKIPSKSLVICGMMTHMCIDSTTRAAYELGYQSILINDATATRDLSYAEQMIRADAVQIAYLAALGRFAKIQSCSEFLAQENHNVRNA